MKDLAERICSDDYAPSEDDEEDDNVKEVDRVRQRQQVARVVKVVNRLPNRSVAAGGATHNKLVARGSFNALPDGAPVALPSNRAACTAQLSYSYGVASIFPAALDKAASHASRPATDSATSDTFPSPLGASNDHDHDYAMVA